MSVKFDPARILKQIRGVLIIDKMSLTLPTNLKKPNHLASNHIVSNHFASNHLVYNHQASNQLASNESSQIYQHQSLLEQEDSQQPLSLNIANSSMKQGQNTDQSIQDNQSNELGLNHKQYAEHMTMLEQQVVMGQNQLQSVTQSYYAIEKENKQLQLQLQQQEESQQNEKTNFEKQIRTLQLEVRRLKLAEKKQQLDISHDKSRGTLNTSISPIRSVAGAQTQRGRNDNRTFDHPIQGGSKILTSARNPLSHNNLDLDKSTASNISSYRQVNSQYAHNDKPSVNHRLELGKLQELLKENQNQERPVISFDFKLN